MPYSQQQGQSLFTLTDEGPGRMTVHLQGRLDSTTAGPLLRELTSLMGAAPPVSMVVDLGKVTYLDDYGTLVLLELRKRLKAQDMDLVLINLSDRVQEILSLLDFARVGESPSFARKPQPNVLVRLGEATLRIASEMRFMVSFVGAVCLAMLSICLHPKTLRRGDTFLYMQRTGVDALPIVALISFLLGLIMAFMSSVQLQQFGANIYVASLVGLAMTREMGPIMTAIIVAGRSGSAFAAEIGTMKISEEVDALFTMGFDPTRFLVIPKVIAAVTMLPILTLFSDLFAMAGGLIVGVSMLGLTANAYVAQTLKTLTLFDIFWGFGKSAAFGLLISGIGCLRGFQVRGGAAAVGQATTSAVVSSIFLVILFDSLFAIILRYWG